MQYRITNILDLLEITGEDDLKGILSDFSCQQNKEIEYFLQRFSESDNIKYLQLLKFL